MRLNIRNHNGRCIYTYVYFISDWYVSNYVVYELMEFIILKMSPIKNTAPGGNSGTCPFKVSIPAASVSNSGFWSSEKQGDILNHMPKYQISESNISMQKYAFSGLTEYFLSSRN